METVSRKSTYLLEQGKKHLSEKLDATMRLQKHRYLVEAAEAAQRKIRRMQVWRSKEDWIKGLVSSL